MTVRGKKFSKLESKLYDVINSYFHGGWITNDQMWELASVIAKFIKESK